jgi:hypothetical protein
VAAKIWLFEQNRAGVKRALEFAKEVTEEHDKHLHYQETMLANIDEALRISRMYYLSKAQALYDRKLTARSGVPMAMLSGCQKSHAGCLETLSS